MRQSADAVVVGGGPAGSIAALILARRGIRVSLLEQKHFPRDKVCGDALIPDAIALLESVDLLAKVEAEAHRAHAARVFAPDGGSVKLEASLLTIKRVVFDSILARAAQDAGANLIEGLCITGPLKNDAGVVTGVRGRDDHGDDVEIDAPITILATGAASQMLASFGVMDRSQPSAVALRTYYEMPNLDPNELIISYEKPVMPGYAWIFPLGNGQANV